MGTGRWMDSLAMINLINQKQHSSVYVLEFICR